jgi:hypothetical protein
VKSAESAGPGPAERGTHHCGVNLATASRITFRPNPSANLVGSAKVRAVARTCALGSSPRAFVWSATSFGCLRVSADCGAQHKEVV